MKNIIIISLLFFISIFCKSFAIEVSSLEAEKKLEFSELFPKEVCNKIYEESSFGKENKLSEEVELKAYFNLKRLNVDEMVASVNKFAKNPATLSAQLQK